MPAPALSSEAITWPAFAVPRASAPANSSSRRESCVPVCPLKMSVIDCPPITHAVTPALMHPEWPWERCIQCLKVLGRELCGKSQRVFFDVLRRPGFRNSDYAPAADHPRQRDGGGRAAMH